MYIDLCIQSSVEKQICLTYILVMTKIKCSHISMTTVAVPEKNINVLGFLTNPVSQLQQ